MRCVGYDTVLDLPLITPEKQNPWTERKSQPWKFFWLEVTLAQILPNTLFMEKAVFTHDIINP